LNRTGEGPPVYLNGMATNSTLVCIHRDPAQLTLLEEHGYELLTATNGRDGLRLFMCQPVDAIVLDYQLGLLDGGIVAAAIKKVKPQLPIVMVAEYMDIPVIALNSVDAVVAKSDMANSLLTIHSVLNAQPAQGPSHRATR
jgi:CheY-like chemotaxis protein